MLGMHPLATGHNGSNSKENSPSEPALPRDFERYRLLKRIARGGMGEVYLATVVGIEGAERPIVIKTVRRDHDTDSSFLARFLDEARIQSQLHHPGVTQILEAANDESGKPYVAVEYVEGRNLADVRSRAAQLGVRVGWAEAVALAVTIGEALSHVHERSDADGKPLEIVHRDLSPQNVMVGYGGELKLIDFGTARGENRRCHTISGVVFAKPGYVAPEVANNTPGGVPADLYAFGVILWELLSGRRFLAGEPAEHLAQVGAGTKVVPAIAASVGAPPELDRVIQKLTAHRLEDRHSSARQATAELVRILQRAPSPPDGDRSVRGRIAQLMSRLYPAEPARSRAEFHRLLGASRGTKKGPPPLPQSPSPPRSDESVLSGTRYRIERELGRGANGVVYEALHLDLGRSVALKVLDREYGGEPARERFVAEARAVARVSHENLVRLYELGFTSEGRPFYAMELVRGETLDRRLARGALAVNDALSIAVGVCRAAGAAHAAGLVHRDIKPQNLMLTEDGAIKLLDFGVAKPEQEAKPADGGDQGALVVIGTPEYMAPEQARGLADARSDVYAIGAVLYELLTGSLPFDAPSLVALIERKLASVPAPPSSVRGEAAISKTLDRIVLRALAADPGERFQSAGALAEALEAVVAGSSSVRSRRRRLGAAAFAAVLLSAVGVLGASIAQGGGLAWKDHERTLRSAYSSIAARFAPPAPTAKAEPPAQSPPDSHAAEPKAPAPLEDAKTPPDSEATDALERPPAELASEEALAAASDQAASGATAPQTAEEVSNAEGASRALTEFAELRGRGRTLKALEVIRHAADTFPEEPLVLRAYVQAAEDTRAWGEARRVAARWVKLAPSYEARLTLARLERATGRPERALALLEKLVDEDPSSKEVRRLLALSGGDPKLALNR